MDRRVSLWDINKKEISIGGYDYVILKEPDRGASCLVYQALWREKVGKKTYDHRILLKEFYPILRNGWGISRNEDGTLEIPEYIRGSEEFQMLADRFQASYETMLELANAAEGAEFISVPTRLLESQGTFYLQEEYDSGTTLEKMYENREYFDLPSFLERLAKCMRAVARLHHRGYYHLDLKPKNISYTRGGYVKLFDTDTFVKNSELDKQTVFMESKGYSAPELHNLAPEDAPELIGPWTDVYSLTQIICWYIYGRPLEEEELDEKLEQMHDVIRRYPRGPGATSSGIYMLQQFIKRNLSSDIEERNQTVGNKWDGYTEAHQVHKGYLEHQRCELLTKKGERAINTISIHDEIMVIQHFMKGPLGEPAFNFKDCRKYLPGHENELEELDIFMQQAKSSRVLPVLTGWDISERETLARYYVTKHKWEYSIVTEVRCDSFEDLWRKIPRTVPGFNNKLENVHVFPWLLVIFDDCPENELSAEEAKEINRLLKLQNCSILIVGRYNRCLNRIKNMDNKWAFPTVEIQERQRDDLSDLLGIDGCTDIDELQDILRELEESGDIPKWSWWGFAGKCMIALCMFVGGLSVCALLSGAAGNYMQYNRLSGQYECSSWGMVTLIMIAHILSTGVSGAGIISGVYRIFDLVTPRGCWYFVSRYHSLFPCVWAGMLSMNMPDIFRQVSFSKAISWIGFSNWMKIDDLMNIAWFECTILFILTITLWVYRILRRKMEMGNILDAVKGASLLVSCIVIVAQTLGNSWELLLFGLCVTTWELWLVRRYEE